ncbi:helix-turn-helix transcriptional regulator [Natrialba sp. SSL1]|uniref:helix-turn-helix transcriptional regulator n=1 Tax=Natrialba sp. SSL1 TaxID=1869245 RepID=UPI0008F86112|nr:helix-turn-helix transcriptional regulator [Natrialba sp. SSL1]OIB55779.1 PadR family transcriptional regulator [Natrialba sp. SSL1]
MDGLSGFQRDLLYVVAGKHRPSGQDIKDGIESYYETEINHGRLYPNLDALVDKELVEKGQVDRRTNYYELTARGERTITSRQQWESKQAAEVPAWVSTRSTQTTTLKDRF